MGYYIVSPAVHAERTAELSKERTAKLVWAVVFAAFAAYGLVTGLVSLFTATGMPIVSLGFVFLFGLAKTVEQLLAAKELTKAKKELHVVWQGEEDEEEEEEEEEEDEVPSAGLTLAK
jgi:hypothetical protein